MFRFNVILEALGIDFGASGPEFWRLFDIMLSHFWMALGFFLLWTFLTDVTSKQVNHYKTFLRVSSLVEFGLIFARIWRSRWQFVGKIAGPTFFTEALWDCSSYQRENMDFEGSGQNDHPTNKLKLRSLTCHALPRTCPFLEAHTVDLTSKQINSF